MKPAGLKGGFKMKIKRALLKCLMIDVQVKGINSGRAGSPEGPIPKSTAGLRAQVKNPQISLEKQRGSSFWRLLLPEPHRTSPQQDCCEQRRGCFATRGEDLFSRGQVHLQGRPCWSLPQV